MLLASSSSLRHSICMLMGAIVAGKTADVPRFLVIPAKSATLSSLLPKCDEAVTLCHAGS